MVPSGKVSKSLNHQAVSQVTDSARASAWIKHLVGRVYTGFGGRFTEPLCPVQLSGPIIADILRD